jgi:hypothetical protein
MHMAGTFRRVVPLLEILPGSPPEQVKSATVSSSLKPLLESASARDFPASVTVGKGPALWYEIVVQRHENVKYSPPAAAPAACQSVRGEDEVVLAAQAPWQYVSTSSEAQANEP